MTAASITLNPGLQTNFPNTFFATSTGFTQGDALDGPAESTYLRKAIVSPTATQVMWGGLAINEAPAVGKGGPLGSSPPPGAGLQSILAPATTITAAQAGTFRGFTVFNQAVALIKTAQANVAVAGAGMAINFYRVGSGARIPVQALTASVAAWLSGAVLDAAVYWDTVNLWVTHQAGANIIGPLPGVTLDTIPVTNNSRVVNMTAFASTGFANWTETGAAVVIKI